MNMRILIEFIVSLSILLFVHEFGHFFVGRLMGIHAEEFGFGYPPRIKKLFSWKGTDFTINSIPFGAFVRFPGEDDPLVESGFYNANKWKRLATLLAGPIMNILTGILLFSLVVSQTGVPDIHTVEIVGVAAGSPAEDVGLLPNDVIKSINGIEIDGMDEVGKLVKQYLGEEIEMIVERDGGPIGIIVSPRVNPPQGEGAIGITMQNPTSKIGFIPSIPIAGNIAIEQVRQLLSVPGMLLRGEVAGEDARMLSPKGIYDVYAQVKEDAIEEETEEYKAWLDTAWFFGVISISLGFSNLLPIPALDGGRILFIIPEIFFKKRVPAKYENIVHMVGYFSLLAIMGYVFLQDFLNPIVLP